MTDLLALAERCEKATGPDRELDAAIQCAFPDKAPHFSGVGVCNAFTASLDAAMTLVPEGWTDIRQHQHLMTDNSVRCYAEIELDDGQALLKYEGKSATPALALCAAALRVMGASNGQS